METYRPIPSRSWRWFKQKVLSLSLLTSLSFFIGLIDYITGPDFSFSPGYLIPPAISAWKLSRNWGGVLSLINSLLWLWVDFSSGRYSPIPSVYVWNFASRLIFLIVIVFLISSIRKSLDHEKHLSRTDFLTKALNSRVFKEALILEINRSLRYHHPMTLVYLDIDNFKAINDQYGHSEGDAILCSFAQVVQNSIRHTDVLGRMGGDEFAILLVETDPNAAKVAVSKIRHNLMTYIESRGWPISVSFGVLTCSEEFDTAENLVRLADQIMYSVKKTRKNDAAYMIYKMREAEA